VVRLPLPLLRPFVERLWATDDPTAGTRPWSQTEHALPTGRMHLVFRMTDLPLQVRESPTDGGMRLRGAVIGGVRPRYFIRELSAPACSVGVVLRPGAARLLFGGGADELAGRHTALADVWGGSAEALRERLMQARGAGQRLALLEAALAARLPRARALHPAIAAVLGRMDAACTVADAVTASGLSHRHFIARFRAAVGLPPKAYLRVQRFQQALQCLRAGDRLAAVAATVGYSDQAHFSRDFVAFSGVTPKAYRSRMPAQANHLPIAPPSQICSRPGQGLGG
jgi:AraC-like DNA-binding protein